jgi:hypothetical protein
MDLRRLIPVTLVTAALGISFSPMVSAQRADQLPAPVAAVTQVTGLAGGAIGTAARAAAARGAAVLPGRSPLPGLAPADYGSGSDSGAVPSQYIAVRTKGDAKDESKDPLSGRHQFTFPLYSMVDGSLVGTATDDVACSSTTPPPCAVVDAITTFRFTQGTFPLGTLVNEGQVSIAPDAQHPGFIINGVRGSGNTIKSATGDYAGHTATISISGGNDVHNFPMELIQDDFWLIEVH